jgi:DNA-binding transcriptional MerR regulator
MMTTHADTLWTIDDLGARVAVALSVDYEGPANGRVRAVPDQRTIRYYTTLGLIDRPAEMRGRTALYGPRHLLQLVAIKRLQAKGATLAELQQQLVGLPDSALARIARLPADVGSTPAAPSGPAERAAAFWMAPPAAAAAVEEAHADAGPVPLAPLQGVWLADEVTLLLSPARPLEPDDLEALRSVAAPLLKLLEKRRLLRPRQERRSS